MQTADHPKSLKARTPFEPYHFALSACGKTRPTAEHDFAIVTSKREKRHPLQPYFFVCFSWIQFADFWNASCEA
jgi:hypothetical protein